jgi:negative regulator of flagellin synthesis FlgM
MKINGVGYTRPIQNPGQVVQREIPAQAPAQLPATDRLELSGVGSMMKSLKDNSIRADKVADVKAQIAAGTYDDEKKLDGAVDKLLDDLG